MNTHSDFVGELAAAIADHAPLPAFPKLEGLAEAYQIQHQVTAARTRDQIGGIKAGVTAPMVQKMLGLEHALIASLYADSRLSGHCKFDGIAGRAIECEVAVFVDNQGNPQSIAPAIEVVLVNFSEQSDMNAANLVACNLGADLHIVGEQVPWDPRFNDTTAILRHDGETVNEADMKDAIGGPENAAKWMWQEADDLGFELGGETMFMTGACGNVVPAEPGQYAADFGDLGKVEFEVSASS